MVFQAKKEKEGRSDCALGNAVAGRALGSEVGSAVTVPKENVQKDQCAQAVDSPLSLC